MKETSIFRKVLRSNLRIMLIPIILIMLIIASYMSIKYRNDLINETRTDMYDYIENVNIEVEKAVSISENIARFPLIFKGLNADYKSYYDVFVFLDETKDFLDNITYAFGESSLMICFANDDLFEGKYFISAKNVANYDEIFNHFKISKKNLIWDYTIHINNKGQQYFEFYEYMPINYGSFIIGRVYLPKHKDGIKDSIQVVKSGEDYPGVRTDIRERINVYFDVVSEVDYGQIFRRYIQIALSMLITTTLLVILLFYTTRKTTDRVTGDIDKFIKQLDVENIAKGNLDLEVRSGEATELSIIKETISGLLGQIKKITDSNHKTELEKKTLEFELLQSQIDPHTMYNSLSAIRLSAFKRKDDELVEFVDNMVSYYRKVLNKGKTLCTLSDELDMIKKYVTINEMSHYKKYNLSIDCDKGLMNAEILHLLLQPFVENAIIHGLVGSKSDCKINIRCIEDNGYLEIKITDNGRGMNKETLKNINNLDMFESGYGVKNAYMRLKLYYGDRSSVHFESVQNEGTTVTIKFSL